MTLEPATYYTPDSVISVCVGFTPTASSLSEETRFRVVIGSRRYTTTKTGIDGLHELKGMLLADDHQLPDNFGEAQPIVLSNLKITENSVIANLPKYMDLPQTRLTFQYRDSYGSFNRAVKNALSAVRTYKTMRSLIATQQEQVEKSTKTLRAFSTVCADLANGLDKTAAL